MAVDLGTGFDASKEETMGEGFTLFPEGIHLVSVSDSEEVNLTDKPWAAIKMILKGVEGVAKGVNVEDLIFTHHETSEKAVSFGKKKLSSYCHAVEVLNLKSTGELHGKLLKVKIKHEKQGEYTNANVKAIYPADFVEAANTTTPTTASNSNPFG